ncbi:hypothetical protein HW571_29420 [Agrobacterium genomosp. 3]|uniref:hypothetical protein n=1 Tax=Agrobacterium tomkonis TaxID=1183410 RepID=UPI001CD8D1F8|nr:hypothetical protein [Agrobacterium tomkonis]MCA1880040.1 hypothetical protein [Agrobacterium tumefaciens]MCA1895297.1 hypothetical protein [Agrobacterium tomkonis]
MAVDLKAANLLPPRSDEFFRIFARFEFALKMAGYCQLQKDKVEIDWDGFANSSEMGKPFFKIATTSGLCPTMLSDPPKAETINNGQWGFASSAAKPVSAQDLMGLVRRVRNNMFHGGKYFSGDAKRDAALVFEAIAVLLAAVEIDPDINFFFEGRA